MIYARTAAGDTLLKHPHNGLSMDVAVMLMQIDGRTDTDRLGKRNPRFEVPTILNDLKLAGLIEAKPMAAAAPAPIPQPAATPELAQVRALGREAARLISHALGPQADRLALALERAEPAEVLAYQLELAREQLKRFRKDEALRELDFRVSEVLAPQFYEVA